MNGNISRTNSNKRELSRKSANKPKNERMNEYSEILPGEFSHVEIPHVY
jgi:protein tyrosine phosphatase